MKLRRLTFSGFRGARSIVSLDFTSGFVVIVGRNGSGKSTICDAIEYAITGDLRPDAGRSEKGEGIQDYLWWRGDRSDESNDRFVELTLIDAEGRQHRIRRTPTSVDAPAGLTGLLCRSLETLDLPLAQLCRTAILRDEDIARLSIDLKETERFEAVRAALGTADFSTTEHRAVEVAKLVDVEHSLRREAYELANRRLVDLTAALSQARTDVREDGQIGNAERLLRELIPDAGQGIADVALRAEQLLARGRVRVDSLVQLFTHAEDVARKTAAARTPEHRATVARLEKELQDARQALEKARKDAEKANADLAKAQANSPSAASLAVLVDQGERLGLIDGGCPLCGTKQSTHDFQQHLRRVAVALTATSADLKDIAKRAAIAASAVVEREAEVARREAAGSGAALAAARLREEQALQREADAVGFDLLDEESRVERLGKVLDEARAQNLRVEQALALVRASSAVERVALLERELSAAREDVATAERQHAKAGVALHAARGAVDTVRRVRGEFIDEQLAQLEPLLLELYQRLRPHVDWRQVRYRLRGDVRRMLRLEVGEGINPGFVFSSGQRRAVGLAFLLALHLARHWSMLDSLILDDPVQHIDDFRALHLTEVLAAVRRTKRQVVCTVEDESLARLLCRRLRSDSEDGGALVRMAYSSRDGIHVESTAPVQPLPKSLLIPA